jgi:hypothetical protein
MFPKKSGLTVHDAKFIKITRFPCTRLASEEPWRKANAITHEKKRATADKNTRFKENSQKPPKNKLYGLNAKSAATCDTKTAYAYES